MKTHFLALLSVVLLSTATTFADVNTSAPENMVTPAAELLENSIQYPFRAERANIEGSVCFEIRSTREHQLEYISIAYDHELLKKEVEEQVKKLESKLLNVMEPGTSQKIKLNFVLK